MKRKSILKYAVLALLASVGTVLMCYVKIPYPIAPFLEIEVSDFVVIFAYLLFGFKEALLVGVLKTLANLIFLGPVGPYAVGQITALIASMSYVLAFFLANLIIRSDKIGFKIIKYVLVCLFVSTIMVIANYFFLTPIFLGKMSFLDMTGDSLASITGINSYLLSIIVLYYPFNLLKGALISILAILIGDVVLKIFQNKIKKESDTGA